MQKNQSTPKTKSTTKPALSDQPSSLSIVSMVLGILSLTGFGLLLGIPAIITGVLALKRTTADRGLSWTGIITGSISTLLSIVAILVIIALLLLAAFSTGASVEYYQAMPEHIQSSQI